jgi:DNA-binding MarR family transcriptional regulator
MATDETLPPELAGFDDASFAEILPYLKTLSREPEREKMAGVLSALLLDRTLHLLRRGSRRELADECWHLSEFLESKAGEELLKARPDVHGGWGAFADLTSEAAQRCDRAAVDSILLSHRGRGGKLLELLARQPDKPVRRAEIRAALQEAEGSEVSDPLISHLLRDLEEADLIFRYRPEGSKEVLVELGPIGREVVKTQILPTWVEYLIARLEELSDAAPTWDAETLRMELEKQGATSSLLAERIAQALARLAPV